MSDDQDDASRKTYRHEGIDFSPIYTALGVFTVEFERICADLRFAYSTLLQRDGLRTWGLGTNLLNLPVIGPGHLANAFCAGIHQVSDDEGLRCDASKLAKEIQKLAEDRNEILHGEWIIGPDVVIISDQEFPPEQNGIKRKTSKRGEKITELPTTRELNELVMKSRSLRQDIQNISSALRKANIKANPERWKRTKNE